MEGNRTPLSAAGRKGKLASFALAVGVMVARVLASEPSHTNKWQVYFSPSDGCTEAVVKNLNNARTSICVQAYSFTSASIAKALVDAHKRRVKVQVILDKSQRTEKYSSADFLRNSGIPTFIDAEHVIAHNKIMVIDGHVVITGSFNFTKAAEQHNAENLMVIDDPGLAERYAKNWQQHLNHSPAYASKPPSKR